MARAVVDRPTSPTPARRPVHRLGRRHGAVLRAGRQRRPLSVAVEEEGKASGANNAIREVGGVFGVAVLASVFSRRAGTNAQTFTDGLVPAIWIGAAVVLVGAGLALLIPRVVRRPAAFGDAELALAA